MKPMTMMGVIFALALAAWPPLAAEDKKASALLQAGQAKETVQGDLKAAIQIYGQAVKEAGANRALAAKALVHMAECYQKMGDSESRKIYERVLREYSDQKDLAAIARTRLGGNAAHSAGLATRQVWAGPKVDIEGTISPDGRYLSYVDWDTGDLALHDLVTGGDRRLTNKGTWAESDEFAEESAISRDGKQVAYSWFNKDLRYELRLASLNGDPKPRRLLDSEDIDWIAPLDWSPDGKWLAVQVSRKDRTHQIGLVGVADGSLRVLRTGDWSGIIKMFFSPDGRYLALDVPAGESTGQRGSILLLAIDGSREIPAVVHPSQNTVMGWSPDGKHLLFGSDRSGSMGIWALSFAEGKPQGAPALIKPDIGRSWSMGVTLSGALYYGVFAGDLDIQVAAFDFATGDFLSSPVKPVQNFVGSNAQPDWSPDGKYLGYLSRRDIAGSTRNPVLAIRSMETGLVRELRPRLVVVNLPRWAPDGRSFAAAGIDPKGRQGVFQIDAQSGDVSLIVAEARRPQWSPDGKRIYFVRSVSGKKDTVCVERDLASGNEREVIRRAGLGGFEVSPDGSQLAITAYDPSAKSVALLVIAVTGGEPRELLRVNQPQSFGSGVLGWTPDGRGVLIKKQLSATGDHGELWLAPVAGGQPRKLSMNVDNLEGQSKIRVHPDGRQIAFASGRYLFEVWVIENFLPAVGTKQ